MESQLILYFDNAKIKLDLIESINIDSALNSLFRGIKHIEQSDCEFLFPLCKWLATKETNGGLFIEWEYENFCYNVTIPLVKQCQFDNTVEFSVRKNNYYPDINRDTYYRLIDRKETNIIPSSKDALFFYDYCGEDEVLHLTLCEYNNPYRIVHGIYKKEKKYLNYLDNIDNSLISFIMPR